MTEKTQLFIGEPCHEQWGDMRPDAGGRFCGSCRKTVVDFTMMSDQEVLAWLSGAGKSVCGRFMEDQLNRDLSPSRPPKRSRWAVWQFLLSGLLLSSEVSAQEKPLAPPVSQMDSRTDEVEVVAGLVSSRRAPAGPSHITIRVVDSISGEPVPWASVRIDKAAFSTDSTGSLQIPREKILRAHSMEVSSVGYERKALMVNKNMLNEGLLTISLPLSRHIMGDVVVVTSRTVMGKMGLRCDTAYTFGRWVKDTLSLFSLTKKPLTVYPNPVARGASITISLRDIKPGTYMVQLFSTSGVLVETMRLEGVDGARTELLNIPETVAAGPYFVKLLNTITGKIAVQKLVVL
jgi:hypothetical protein